MLNSTITIKIKQRLNKLDSNDYDNIECWQIVEAFNKAQVEWVRRQLHGGNQYKEGDEGSTRRKDDLQVLLKEYELKLTTKKNFYISNVPQNYLQWKRVDIETTKDCCTNRKMIVYFAEEGDLSMLLRDAAKKPSFEWGETFATLMNNKIKIYNNEDFEISKGSFTYYKQPEKIQILNCVDPYTSLTSATEVQCEFKDDIIELLIDEAVSILAGDMESNNQFARGSANAEKNN
jgi:hypothetical protein